MLHNYFVSIFIIESANLPAAHVAPRPAHSFWLHVQPRAYDLPPYRSVAACSRPALPCHSVSATIGSSQLHSVRASSCRYCLWRVAQVLPSLVSPVHRISARERAATGRCVSPRPLGLQPPFAAPVPCRQSARQEPSAR